MDFAPSDKSRNTLAAVQRFMDELVYPAEPLYAAVLDQYFAGAPDESTLQLL